MNKNGFDGTGKRTYPIAFDSRWVCEWATHKKSESETMCISQKLNDIFFVRASTKNIACVSHS